MKIDRDELVGLPAEEAARVLHEAGRGLRGTNLKRSSWLVIAESLQVTRIAPVLLARLEAARTREDALRVLRIARKWNVIRKGAKGGARKTPKESPQAVAADTSPQMYKADAEELDWLAWVEMEEFGDPHLEFERWLAEEGSKLEYKRVPGLLPVSPWQDAIDRCAWERRPRPQPLPEDLRSRLDDDTYRRLRALADVQPVLELSMQELDFLRRFDLTALLQFAAEPDQLPAGNLTIRDGLALNGLHIIEGHTGRGGHPFHVDWAATAGWLAERLAAPADPAGASEVISALHIFFHQADTEQAAGLLRGAGGWHRHWRAAQVYAMQRIDELLPRRVYNPPLSAGWWDMYEAHAADTRWEQLLDAGVGSRLVLHNLRCAAEDLFVTPVKVPDRYWNAARRLLMSGGGTLRRMDYPAFTLTCRPSITLVRLETFEELVRLAREIMYINQRLTWLHEGQLPAWIAGQYQALAGDLLPEGLSSTIAGALERHAAAYLMLKHRILRGDLQAAPFRLRRRHITRFWESAEAGEIEQPFPADFGAMKEAFGTEAVKEALAHALLDRFKDDWGLEPGAAFALKETALTLLRCIAVSFHMEPPWLPAHANALGEEDLEHTAEVANFIVRQTGHGPLELAQALLIDPRQGLPLLAGGQVTELEKACRRAVRAAAGVSARKVEGGAAHVYTCRPLSKTAALDRGTLGGDCSSGSVPLRALSPHHTYYGVFQEGVQQRGYMTVYEAWAELEDGAGRPDAGETGEGAANHAQGAPSAGPRAGLHADPPPARFPVLCLETINVPIRIFDSVQQDLLVLFEAVAQSRGLTGGLVLITDINTWNYHNGQVLRQSRRFRQGQPVRLYPADPAAWNVYRLATGEADQYTAFFFDVHYQRDSGPFRLLAPLQPELDPVEPENLAEAARIAALPQRRLVLTARKQEGPAGFISELPEVLSSSLLSSDSPHPSPQV